MFETFATLVAKPVDGAARDGLNPAAITSNAWAFEVAIAAGYSYRIIIGRSFIDAQDFFWGPPVTWRVWPVAVTTRQSDRRGISPGLAGRPRSAWRRQVADLPDQRGIICRRWLRNLSSGY